MPPQHLLNGRPVSLCILDYGLFRVHSGPRDIGIMGVLITTDRGEQVLVDTGLPAKYADDPVTAATQDNLSDFGEVLHCTSVNLPAAQLALAGSAPDRISLMIQTHTHIDHLGGIDMCRQAPMVIAAAERALPRPLYWNAAQPLDWPERDYVLVDGDVQIGPGFQVLLTPGHAPGQLALMVDLPRTGPVLFTSDAISRPAEVDERFAGSWDAGLAMHHAARLLDRARTAGALVIYGHCPDQWPGLKKAPDAYR